MPKSHWATGICTAGCRMGSLQASAVRVSVFLSLLKSSRLPPCWGWQL